MYAPGAARLLPLLALLTGWLCAEAPEPKPVPAAFEDRIPKVERDPHARTIAPTKLDTSVSADAPTLPSEDGVEGTLPAEAGDDPAASPPDVAAKPQ